MQAGLASGVNHMWQILIKVGRTYEEYKTCSSYPEAIRDFHRLMHEFPDSLFSLSFNENLLEYPRHG